MDFTSFFSGCCNHKIIPPRLDLGGPWGYMIAYPLLSFVPTFCLMIQLLAHVHFHHYLEYLLWRYFGRWLTLANGTSRIRVDLPPLCTRARTGVPGLSS